MEKSSLFIYLAILPFTMMFASCNKFDEIWKSHKTEHQDKNFLNTNGEFRQKYKSINEANLNELTQVRTATEKYRNIEKALKDGYADISVDVPNMGHHYMKSDLVNETFDLSKPEILVYNKDHNGKLQLVAVEYAIPIDLSPNAAPAGFTGDADVWDRNTGFGLWLLHAWVWYYNPEGVFNPTNSLVHLH